MGTQCTASEFSVFIRMIRPMTTEFLDSANRTNAPHRTMANWVERIPVEDEEAFVVWALFGSGPHGVTWDGLSPRTKAHWFVLVRMLQQALSELPYHEWQPHLRAGRIPPGLVPPGHPFHIYLAPWALRWLLRQHAGPLTRNTSNRIHEGREPHPLSARSTH